MSEAVNPKLVKELAKLVRAFEPSDFQALISAVRNDEFREELLQCLASLEDGSRAASQQKLRTTKEGARPSRQAPAALQNLRDSDPEKFNFLNQLRLQLSRKRLLSTRRQVVEFCNEVGVRVDGAMSRGDAIARLIEHLAEQPLESIKELASRLDARRPPDVHGGRLEEWADVIMRKSL